MTDSHGRDAIASKNVVVYCNSFVEILHSIEVFIIFRSVSSESELSKETSENKVAREVSDNLISPNVLEGQLAVEMVDSSR